MVGIYLKRVQSIDGRVDPKLFPWALPVFRQGLRLDFKSPVTFFVGENGSGKSTLLEALAGKAEFNPAGGNRNHAYSHHATESGMAAAIRAQWARKPADGFFLRAESFYNFATYYESVGSRVRGSLHARSHGEAFLTMFTEFFQRGLFLLDEPEAALSPSRQLTLLARLHELVSAGESQFIIASHSPILMAYPGADIVGFDGGALRRMSYHETDHYRISRDFLNEPERFLRHLIEREKKVGPSVANGKPLR